MEHVFNGRALGVKYEIHRKTGIVVQSNLRYGIGNSNIAYQTIFLEDEDGNESTMKLQNQEEIHCKSGQTLTVLLIGLPKDDFKEYFFWYNHNTGDEYIIKSVINLKMFPWTIIKICIALVFVSIVFPVLLKGSVGGIIAATIGGLIAGAIVFMILSFSGHILSTVREKIILKNRKYKKLITEVKNSDTKSRNSNQVVFEN